MAANKRKILEAARKHAQKGAKDKALKEYDKLLKLDPRDAKLRLEIGDAHRRWGQTAEARETYNKVAEQFMKEGFDARAVAVYKQIQNLDSEAFDSCEPLAELYQRMGLTSEAIGTLQMAADGYRKAGDKEAALGVLRKMATIDPSNTTSRLKVADLLQQEGMTGEALLEYDAVTDELERQGDLEGMSRTFERILEIEPTRVETLRHYAQCLLDRGVPARAESLAKQAIEVDASPEHYELLANVYRATRREDDLAQVYAQLAEVYRERGDEERSREILQRYGPAGDLSTSDPSKYLNAESAEEPGEDGDELALGDEGTLLDEDLLADESLLLGESGFFADEASSVEGGPHSNEMTVLAGSFDDDPGHTDPEQLFAEASVYLRYGKRDQAIENLEIILHREPNHRAALERLGEAHSEAGDAGRAVEVWSRAAKVAAQEADVEGVSVLRNRIEALDPEAAAAIEIPERAAPEPALGDDLLGDELTLEDELIEASEEPTGAGTANGSESAEAPVEPTVTEIDFDDIEVDIDDESFEPGDLEADLGGEAEPDSDEPAVESGDEEASAPAADAAASQSAASPQQVTEDLEEADFYFQQGLFDEAEAIYTRVLKAVPGHPHVQVRMGELAAQRGEDPGTAATASVEMPDSTPEFDVPDEPTSGDLGEDLAAWDGDPEDSFTGADDESIPTDSSDESPVESLESRDLDAETPAGSGDDGWDLDEIDIDLDDSFDAGSAADEEPVPEDSNLGLADDANADSDEDSIAAASQAPAADEVPIDDDTTADALNLDDIVFDEEVTTDELDLPREEPAEAAALDPEPALDSASAPMAELTQPSDEDSGAGSDDTLDGPADEVESDCDLDAVTRDPIELDADAVDMPDPDADDDATPEPVAAADESGLADLAAEFDDSEEDEPDEGAPDFDLAAELSEALDDPNGNSGTEPGDSSDDGFAAVFAEFKKGVDATLVEGDHEAHYDLGIAYREMGLLGDALTEFRAASEDPARTVDCLHMMGLCAMDQGEPEEAVGYFREALARTPISADQELAVRFELGRGLEATGEIEAAREAYEAVRAVDASFCDVEARIEALDDPEKPGDEPTSEYETFDEFFDDSDEADQSDDDEGEGAEPGGDESQEIAAESYESFDDVIEEAEAIDDEPEADAAPEISASPSASEAQEPEPALEPPSEPDEAEGEAGAVEDDREPVAAADSEPPATEEEDPAEAESEEVAPKRKSRKKKKISFV